MLEDYARAHGVEGRRWQKPFTAGYNAAEAETLRKKLTAPIEGLRAELKDARTAAASAARETATPPSIPTATPIRSIHLRCMRIPLHL
jgi:hypothetical protein